jgi:hypothetical protein
MNYEEFTEFTAFYFKEIDNVKNMSPLEAEGLKGIYTKAVQKYCEAKDIKKEVKKDTQRIGKCEGITVSSKKPCKNKKLSGEIYCKIHLKKAGNTTSATKEEKEKEEETKPETDITYDDIEVEFSKDEDELSHSTNENIFEEEETSIEVELSDEEQMINELSDNSE